MKTDHTNRHLTAAEAALFIYSKEFFNRSFDHVRGCAECRLKALAWKESCQSTLALFEKVYRGVETVPVRQAISHLSHCPRCSELYREKVRQWSDAELDALEKSGADGKERYWVRMLKALGSIDSIAALVPPRLAYAAASGPTVASADIQKFAGRDFTLTLEVDGRRRLVAWYDSRTIRKGVTVAIGHRRKAGFEVVRSAITDDRGKADLGPVKALPPPAGRQRYRVAIGMLKT
jgi:hypothetical protein